MLSSVSAKPSRPRPSCCERSGSQPNTASRTSSTRPSRASDELGQEGGRPGGTVGLDGAVAHRAADLLSYRRGERLRPGLGVVHAPAGAVLGQPVPDVEVLLEVIAQRQVDEGALARGELHGGGQ